MKECCATCNNNYKIEKSDYSHGGCNHSWPEGFICMAFANEGIATWMVGNDPNFGRCEVYSPKRKERR